MQRMRKALSRSQFIKSSAGAGAIILATIRWSIKVWFVTGIVIVIVVIGFLMASQKPTVNAATESEAPLDCLSCHTKTLKGHDKLGSGNKACWTCHDKTEMTTLHLAGGETRFPLSDFPRLCAQCHQERYEAWIEGTHGVAWQERQPTIPGTDRVKCNYCHDPHQPQIAFLNITKPHPPPTSSPPSLPVDPLIIGGISLLVMMAAGLVIATRGERL